MSAGKALLGVVVVAIAMGAGLVVLDRPERSAPRMTDQPADRPSGVDAVRVARRFLVGLDADTLLDRAARERFVVRWATSGAVRRLQQMYAAEAERLAPLANGYSRSALLGYRMPHVDARSAVVAIWAVSIASVGDAPTVMGWRTFEVSLAKEDHRWKVTDVQESPGPTLRSSPAGFRSRARGFREFRVGP